ncbi:uncharacterized protein ARMOST_19451 [Armillaria ostoyae]|uniref:Uncharacterized protein n=1 Tax=Armillaria ostoyae TaxID=47428 RepID=A0A284S4L6_ARMOS|nr:uncharacterized protein ARMOST_19451 [Armillaria ostoyae]
MKLRILRSCLLLFEHFTKLLRYGAHSQLKHAADEGAMQELQMDPQRVSLFAAFDLEYDYGEHKSKIHDVLSLPLYQILSPLKYACLRKELTKSSVKIVMSTAPTFAATSLPLENVVGSQTL